MFPAGANNYSHNQQVIPFRARIRQLVLCWQSSAVDNSEEGGQEAQATCHGVSYSSRKPRISRRAPSYSGTSPTTATTVLHALTSRSQHGIHIGISDRFCKYREMFFCTACIASLRLPEAPYPNSRSNPAARDAHLCLPGLPAATDDRQLVGIHTIKAGPPLASINGCTNGCRLAATRSVFLLWSCSSSSRTLWSTVSAMPFPHYTSSSISTLFGALESLDEFRISI